MLHSRLSIILLLAATCLLMRAGLSGAQQVSPNFPTSSFTESVITCDDTNNVHRLSCESGAIFVQTALYGRADTTTCSEGKTPQQLANTKCSLPDTLDIMRKRCNGKRVCELNANTVRTSDPCPGINKYLETTYTCVPAIFSITCEKSLASLQCDGGQVIFVYGADYGRRDPTTCSFQRPAGDVQTVCSLPTTKVAESCNGKSSCTIRVVNSVFGDPCDTTYKYLEVAYTCQYPGI